MTLAFHDIIFHDMVGVLQAVGGSPADCRWVDNPSTAEIVVGVSRSGDVQGEGGKSNYSK